MSTTILNSSAPRGTAIPRDSITVRSYSMNNTYYVYQYLREDGTPYYIGKGKNRRAWVKQRAIPLPTDLTNIQILKENLTESEAFELESKLIAYYGRKDNGTGILRNLTDGGEGSRNVSNKVAWNKGLKQTPEHNAKIKASMKAHVRTEEHQQNINKSLKGRKPSFLGRKHSEETKQKLREYFKGRPKTKKS